MYCAGDEGDGYGVVHPQTTANCDCYTSPRLAQEVCQCG